VLRYLPLSGVNEVEIGYALYPQFWGRGLATEVAAACLELARGQLHLDSVVAVTTPSNGASQRVLLKIGLLHEREIVLEGARCSLFRIRWPLR
jgi:ribosomal-protein-alanine N-acetyltransferase